MRLSEAIYPPLPSNLPALLDEHQRRLAEAQRALAFVALTQTPRNRWEWVAWLEDGSIACSWPGKAGDAWVGHGEPQAT